MKLKAHSDNEALEAQLASELESLLAGVPVGAMFKVEPSSDFCSSLELFIPKALSREYPEWLRETLDGVFVARARKLGLRAVELVGTCILMSDQTVTPLSIELKLSPSDEDVASFQICLGAAGKGRLGISGPACNSPEAQELLASVAAQNLSIAWTYQVTSEKWGS